RREAHMRTRIAASDARSAAIVGAFHAAALLDPPLLFEDPGAPADAPTSKRIASLVPYAFELLDSRSGYPAGIRDPMWQERALAALSRGEDLADVAAVAATDIVRELRAMGHPAGVPDAKAAVRMALDLAALRGLPSPGRRELVESIESCLAQGERLGRG